MKQIFLIFLLSASIPSLIISQGWFQQSSGTGMNLNEVQFTDEFNGFIAAGYQFGSSGYVLKTSTGGSTWFISYNSATPIYTINFINSNTGYAAGTSSNVMKTTNGGLTWSALSSTYPYRRRLFFLNSNIGYSISSYPYIVYTTTGGLNWLAYTNIFCTDCYFRDVWFINTNTGFLAGWISTFKTTDAGSSWISIFNERTCISFKDSTNGILGGPQRTINRTTNSGQSWTQIHSSGSYSDYILDLNYIDSLNIAAVGSGGFITRTTNAGTNWNQQTGATSRNLTGVFFINANTGWAVGDTGIILKTTTGGFTGLQHATGYIPEEFSLSQNYPNPFNPTTKIRFDIPLLPARRSDNAGGRGVDAEGRRGVSLIIYDILGREVATLVNEQLQPGTYEVEWDASNFASGVYYYKIIAGDYTETRKMVLIK